MIAVEMGDGKAHDIQSYGKTCLMVKKTIKIQMVKCVGKCPASQSTCQPDCSQIHEIKVL